MNRYALVKNGVVQTIVEAESLLDFPDIASFLVECAEEVQCNWTYDGYIFHEPVKKVTAESTRSILLSLLVEKGIITEEEKALLL